MIMLGIDAHKRSHTVVVVDELGRRLGVKTTTATTSADHLELIRWADQFGADRTWAVEDCRHLSRQLERDMLGAGERLGGQVAGIDGGLDARRRGQEAQPEHGEREEHHDDLVRLVEAVAECGEHDGGGDAEEQGGQHREARLDPLLRPAAQTTDEEVPLEPDEGAQRAPQAESAPGRLAWTS